MKMILKRGLSLVLTLIMVVGLLPVTAFAAVDSSGKPTDLNNTVVLSIYTPEGSFPGEPAMHGSEDYISFSSSFAKTSASGKFKDNATTELKESILDDMVQGASNGSNTVWGVFSADGLKEKYFKSDASIIQPANEAKIIRVIKGSAVRNMTDDEILKKYEIIWYVIKLQHSPGSGWWNRGTTEWHIDGLIKEKSEEVKIITINYYGNGNTEGSAPDGITNHVAGQEYTVLGNSKMKKKINGVYVDFLGWSAKADGTGAEAGFYQPGDKIAPTESLSLYAMWDTTTQYTAKVNTYLDNVLTDEDEIHGDARDLYLSTDEVHYYQLTRSGEGVYTTKITGNGKFHLYNKSGNTYTKVGDRQLTIYNQDGSMDVYHYSLTYDLNGGSFETVPGKQIYYFGDTATATAEVPTREGYRFLGWMYNGKLIQPGEEATASVTETMSLVAQWEKTVNVTINVTINHEGGNGHDQMASKDNVTLALVSRANDESPYLEVVGKTLELDNGATNEEQRVTQYLGNMFTDMPGGEVDYTVVTSKSGYDTKITPTQDEDGNWIIDVVMTYNPSNFDLDFTVRIDESVPDRYLPDAAIVKVTFWSTDRQQWEIITQQEGGAPGVRVDIDPETRSGVGEYPVWKYESTGTTPYGYRIQVTSFVYPDGTIVPASKVVTKDVAWTDDVYKATVSDVTGGRKYGTLDGAYIDDATNTQKGKLEAVISMELYNVTFDAQGGKVNGLDSQTLTEQFKIPGFKDYVPTREGGYTFGGWYEDKACTVAATEGEDLTKDITLYAKWIDPLTVSGTVSIAGSYKQNGVDVAVNDIDRAMEAVVVLQELRNGHIYEVDSVTVTFDYDEDHNAAADYSFTGIPNVGKDYQIHVLVLNYGTGYDNESDTDSEFTPNEYPAEFSGDNVADVDAHLTFVPPSYVQPLKVDATQIGEDFRPANVLAEVMYRDTGDNHPFNRISQHNVEPYGVQIDLAAGTEDGESVWQGSGSQSIWKWHTDGTLYDYQMNISRVDGKEFNSDTAPYYIIYGAPAYWNAGINDTSGILQATLIPKKYPVTFNLNAGTDPITGMDAYKVEETDTDEAGNVSVTYAYQSTHTWSYDTAITAVPQREGYKFLGWETTLDGVTADADGNVTIAAKVQQEVVLKAKWEKLYTVTTASDPTEGGTTAGAGTYGHGSQVTVEATPATGYNFLGWYEDGTLVSGDLSYSFEILANRDLTARFSLNQYTVTTEANPYDGGTTNGDGLYGHGTEVTVTATVNPGYRFTGWYDGSEKISDELSFRVTVTENLIYTAKFERIQYNVVTEADPAEGGTTSGDGSYFYGTQVTVKASAETGYAFDGWYEDGEKVSGDAEYSFEVTDNRKLTARFAENGYNVTANHTEGGTTTGTGYYKEGETATVTAIPNQNYVFIGWYNEVGEKESDSAEYSFVVTSDRTLKAEFATAHTITTVASPEGAGVLTGGGMYKAGTSATITAKANGGYYFAGWYDENEKLVTAETSFTLTVLESRTFTARFEKRVSYSCDYVYIFGYDDTQIGATGPLLRGELAQMIYRLVKQKNTSTGNGGYSFSDTAGQWFESGISYMTKVGAIDQNQGKAHPFASVTRGEVYKMLCLGLRFTTDTKLDYTEYAKILRNSGYPAYESKVTAKIQRWEFCELFNAILGRSDYCTEGFFDLDGNEVTAETYGYTDLKPSDPYYRIMMIATSTFRGRRIDVEKRMERNTYDYQG